MPADQAELARLAQAGFEAYSSGDQAEADAHCRRLLEITPDDPDGLHLSGLLRLEAGETAVARDLLARAAAEAPDHPDIRLSLGHAALAAEDLAAALDAFQTARTLNPADPEAAALVAETADLAGDAATAAAAWRDAYHLSAARDLPGRIEELPSGSDLKELATAYAEADGRPTEGPGFRAWWAELAEKLALLPPDDPWEESLAEIGGEGGHDLRTRLLRLQVYLADREIGDVQDWQDRRDDPPVDPTARVLDPDRASELPEDILALSYGRAKPLTWGGAPMEVSAFDLALKVEILSTLRPRTVLEIGRVSPSHALFSAALLQTVEPSGQVHCLGVDAPAEASENLTVYAKAPSDIARVWPADLAARWPHPWAAFIHPHDGLQATLAHLDGHMEGGDLVMILDGDRQADAVSAFLDTARGEYRVDTRLTDFFGRNATSAVDSIFRRV